MSVNEKGAANRIPSLDGLRAVSIIAVAVGHLNGTHGAPRWIGNFAEIGPVDVANLGVRVFFVISGLLITSLLISELERSQSIDLVRFYFRRSIRIFPAYLAFVAVVFVGSVLGALEASGRDFAHALTYTSNYQADRSWNLGHLWSLSLEEQFYLVWPATLAILGLRRVRPVLLGALIVVPILRVSLSTFVPGYRSLIGATFETGVDAIALGCLLAIERERLWENPRWRTLVTTRWAAVALLSVAVLFSLRYRASLLIGVPLANVAIALLVERSVRLHRGLLGRILNSAILVYVGTLSYSIYLTQQLFLNRNSDKVYTELPLSLLGVTLSALLCYYAIERPLLRARSSLERRLLPKS